MPSGNSKTSSSANVRRCFDVAEAQDRYQEALDAASAKQTERVEVEKALNGESVESAQARLEEIRKLIDEETGET